MPSENLRTRLSLPGPPRSDRAGGLEPFHPHPRRVRHGQELDGSSPSLIRGDRQGGEDRALAILIYETIRRFGVLHRAMGLRAQGDERVDSVD